MLQFLADTGLHERWVAGDVNPNGGGISLGHPLGATGARITATLLSELERQEARYGIATMCIGQGQAIAGILERPDAPGSRSDIVIDISNSTTGADGVEAPQYGHVRIHPHRNHRVFVPLSYFAGADSRIDEVARRRRYNG